MNQATKNFELCKITKDNRVTRNVIESGIENLRVKDFEYLARKGRDFYFFNTDNGRKLISKASDSQETTLLTDWGRNQYFPSMIQDTSGQIYFPNYFTDLKLFAVQNDNTLKEKWNVPIKSIALTNEDIYGYGTKYRHFGVVGNKLFFISTKGSEDLNTITLNLFDLESGANKHSKNF